MFRSRYFATTSIAILLVIQSIQGFVPLQVAHFHDASLSSKTAINSASSSGARLPFTQLHASSTSSASFIQNELRGAAMRLHTTEQAPREGKVEVQKPVEPYVTKLSDYLAFLVDSQHVYQAMEDIVNERDELAVFRNTGLERTKPLEKDIEFIVKEYGVERPCVGPAGLEYANKLRQIESIPEFICHYYNHYFAHTAGGLMIGKKMSALLLDKKTLEFYKWEGNINEIKETVKNSIEAMAASWNDEEKQECVAATAAAFQGGGSINAYLSGGVSPH